MDGNPFGGKPFTVYLSGPITGLTYEEAVAQRTEVARKFMEAGLHVLSPMRGKAHLSHQFKDKPLPSGGYRRPALGDRPIMRRDWQDVQRSDIIFVNLLGATEKSIGTIMEIAWTVNLGKFVVVAMERDNVHDHAFVRAAADAVVHDLDEAVQCVIDWAGGMA